MHGLVIALASALMTAPAWAAPTDVHAMFDQAEQDGRVGVARKTMPVDVRPAAPGEVVVTVIAGEGAETRSPPAQPGDMETADGRKVGEHRGLMYYTLGQRQGLRIGGRTDASEDAWYVAGKDLRRNVLVVVQGHGHPALFSSRLTASQLAWVAGAAPAAHFRATAKVRYRQPDQDCEVRVLASGRCEVEFAQPHDAAVAANAALVAVPAFGEWERGKGERHQ